MNSRFKINAVSLVLIVMSVAIYSCGPKQEEIVQNYPSGEVSRRHTVIDGKKEGKMTEYYKDGKIKGERLFENDLQVGKSVFYYPSGRIKETQYFKDGKINGGDTVFYESGKPEFMKTYAEGLMDGYIRKWGEDGTLIYEARYERDSLVEVKGQSLAGDSLAAKRLPVPTTKEKMFPKN